MSNYAASHYEDGNDNNSWVKALQLVPEKSLVLDIGCSSGNFGAELIDRRHCTVDGVELDKQDAALADKHLRHVTVLNIETDSIAGIEEKYDVIYFGDVIEHLVDPVAALRKVSKLLAENGSVVFSIPNMAHATIRLLMLKGDFDYTETGLLDKTHLHFYNQSEVERIFNEAGYEISKIDFVEKDYPNELIDKYLQQIGLKGSKKFYDAMHKTDAAAFQFVGSARPTSNVQPVRRQQFGPIDLFESYFNNTIDPLRAGIKELTAEVTRLRERNEQLEEQWRRLKSNPLKFTAQKVHQKYKRQR